MKKLRYIDLFAGAGGLSLGLYKAGLHAIFAIEKSKDAFSTLKYNLIDKKNHFDWPQWLPQTEHDIREIVVNYKNQLQDLQGKVDLIVGGPPCQGFSMAGKRDHNDIRNTMVNYYLEMIEIVKPTYVMLENVHGFTLDFKNDKNKISYAQLVIDKLTNLGYQVKTKEVLMTHYGVPQKRVRFILIGSLKNNITQFFEQLDDKKDVFLKTKGIETDVTVQDAIGDLLHANGTYKCPDCNQNFQSGIYGTVNSEYQKLMREGVTENPNSHRFVKHTSPTIDLYERMIKTIPSGKRLTPKDGLLEGLKKRGVTLLDTNGQCPTVTSIPDDFVHYCEPRILSVRETARLQSFPDWYEFQGKYTTGGQLRKTDVPRYTQVGNAVPPLFAEQLGNIIKDIDQ